MCINHEDEENTYERPNKSQLKREAQALLELARQLEPLSVSQWRDATLPDHVVDALQALKTIHKGGAKKRQLKLVAKYLRDIDTTDVRAWLEQHQGARREANLRFHRIEMWRDRLLKEGAPALSALLSEYQGVNVQQVNQLLRNARHEAKHQKPPKAAKLLFKLLQDIIH